MAALSADVSRAQPEVKQAYEHKLTALVERIADLVDSDRPDRTRRAWSTVALMDGSHRHLAWHARRQQIPKSGCRIRAQNGRRARRNERLKGADYELR